MTDQPKPEIRRDTLWITPTVRRCLGMASQIHPTLRSREELADRLLRDGLAALHPAIFEVDRQNEEMLDKLRKEVLGKLEVKP